MHTVLLAGWWSSMIWSSSDHHLIIWWSSWWWSRCVCRPCDWLAGFLRSRPPLNWSAAHIYFHRSDCSCIFHISTFLFPPLNWSPAHIFLYISTCLSVCLFHSKALKLVRSITLSREKLKCWFSFPLRQKDKILERNVLHEEAELAGGCFSRR